MRRFDITNRARRWRRTSVDRVGPNATRGRCAHRRSPGYNQAPQPPSLGVNARRIAVCPTSLPVLSPSPSLVPMIEQVRHGLVLSSLWEARHPANGGSLLSGRGLNIPGRHGGIGPAASSNAVRSSIPSWLDVSPFVGSATETLAYLRHLDRVHPLRAPARRRREGVAGTVPRALRAAPASGLDHLGQRPHARGADPVRGVGGVTSIATDLALHPVDARKRKKPCKTPQNSI